MNHRILAIHALSPLHCGSGQGISGIDQPIQRERHTTWPCLPSSSIKGVLRDAFRASLMEKDKINAEKAESDHRTLALFGPEPRGVENDLGLGSLIVGDAFLLLMPVRSLKGVFAWTTCPLALIRLARLLEQAGKTEAAKKLKPLLDIKISDDSVFCAKELDATATATTTEGKVILDDHALSRKDLSSDLSDVLAEILPYQPKDFLPSHLALISNDLFTWFAGHATSVEARIRLDVATKTVEQRGALFYEETLPPEAMLVAPLAAEDARHPKAALELRQAEAALKALTDLVDKKTLQFGGKSTIGRGQCALRLSQEKEPV